MGVIIKDAKRSILDFTTTMQIDKTPNSSKPGNPDAITNRLKQKNAVQEISVEELASQIANGASFMMSICPERTKESWLSCSGFTIDVDNDQTQWDRGYDPLSSVQAVKRAASYDLHPVIAYQTFSSSGEREKYRLVFLFAEQVVDREQFERMASKLLDLFPEADQQTVEGERLFYGTNKQVIVMPQAEILMPDEFEARVAKVERMPPQRTPKSTAIDKAGGPFEVPDEIPAGTRHKTLHKMASSMRAKGYSYEGALAAVKAENISRCNPSYTDEEVEELVKDVYTRYKPGKSSEYQQKEDIEPSARSVVVDPGGWWSNPYLATNAKGAFYAPNVPACLWWLEHPDSGLSHVRYNAMSGTIDAELLPWNPEPHAWADADTSFLFSHMQELTDTLIKSKPNMLDALVMMAHRRKYDPLLDMLELLDEWDGTPRAETLLVDFLGAEDTRYTRDVTRHFLNGAVMRAYIPGIKFDECVVLDSKEQGIGKSTLVNKLNMRDDFFTDSLGDVTKKDAAENMRGKWIIEIGELESLRKREVETVKQFLSRRVDRYRPSYGKNAADFPRRCVFVGTTNSAAFLTDKTGNRRFLPVMCNVNKPKMDVFTELTPEYVGQVWAEVLYDRELNGGALPLVLPRDTLIEADELRETFAVDDPNAGIVLAWAVENCKPGERVCTTQIMEKVFEMPRTESTTPRHRSFQRELSEILDLLPSFERVNKGRRVKHSEVYGQQRCWEYRPRE